jgi:lactoylglutathione lyase
MDLEASEIFYRQALGFEVSRKKDYPGDFTLLYLRAPGSSFELELTFNYGRTEPYAIGNGFSHLAVITPDLEASHQRHRDLGLNPEPIKGLGSGGRGNFYFLADPDGYFIEVLRQ